jgi:hypothetical protein
MYKRDVAIIAEHAANSPQGLVDVVEFVLCTIQAGLSTVKAQRLDIAETGLNSRFPMGEEIRRPSLYPEKCGLAVAQTSSLKRKGAKQSRSDSRRNLAFDASTQLRHGEGVFRFAMLRLQHGLH